MDIENEKRAQDLLDLLKSDVVNIDTLCKYNYHYLASIKWVYGTETFKKISDEIYRVVINNIKKKEKIKVAFLNSNASSWACKKIYKIMEEDDRYEPYVVVVPFFNGTDKTIIDSYIEVAEYFDKHGYRTIKGYNVDRNIHLDWNDIGIPDIIFHQNPHYKGFKESFYLYNLPLSILNVYIPYAFMANNDYYLQYNQMSHLLFWKIFCETSTQKNLFREYCDIGDAHVIVSGYAKMDMFIDNTCCANINDIWKIPDKSNPEDTVKIIYAPHHSLFSGKFGYSTFDKNYMDIYNLARKHSDTTSWIIKPHPLLRKQSVVEGLFKDENEFDEYIEMWNALPNAKAVGDEPYYDIFKTSDGMIFDSQSFRTEYLYVNKPSLYLIRANHDYNDSFDEIGLKVLNVLYSTEGDNIDEIEKFIVDVLIDKNDYKKEDRRKFFDEYLNYFTYNKGKLASEVICDYLSRCFT